MKKILLSLILFASCFSANANEIDKYIQEAGVDNHSILSILVKDKDSNKVVYKRKEEKLLNPASTLKLLTFGSAYLTLGQDYKFETALYKDNKNNLYVKLGADPLLTSTELKDALSDFKKKTKISKINNIYIDDSIIDKEEYPLSWMKSDSWPRERILTPYIIDNNRVKILITRSSLSTKVDVVQESVYKIPIINELDLNDKGEGEHKINVERKFGESSKIISLSGSVNKDDSISLAVLDSKLHFEVKLLEALKDAKIEYCGEILNAKVDENLAKVAFVEHDIKKVSKNILFNSDNFTSEIVFKVAAAKHINHVHPATLEDAISMFRDVFKNEINENIKIADGSGVSRYNLLNAKFYINALTKLLNETDIEKLLPKANQGSLIDRVVFLGDNLRAKTGTLAGISALSGTLKTKKGHNLVFIINNQNSPKRNAVLKNFEDNIVTILYRKY